MKRRQRGHRGLGRVFQREGCKTWTIQFSKDKKRIRERTGTRSRAEAVAILNERVGEIQRNEFVERPKKAVTVDDLFKTLELDVQTRRGRSLGELRRRWKRLKPSFAKMLATNVTTDVVNQYIRCRQTQRLANANATINRELATLKRMFNLGRRSTPPKVRTTPYIPMLPENNIRKGFLEAKQYENVASATKEFGLWLRTMFEMGYTYGWRKGELLGLRVRQVDMLASTIRLDAGTTKNGEGREVTMNGVVRELLALCIAAKGPEDYVFTRTSGERVRDIRPAWKQACTAAGIPGLLFHDLRRTAVRNLVRAGVGDKVSMQISGHKTRSVFDRYNIIDQNDMRKAMEKLEQFKQQESGRNDFKPLFSELSPCLNADKIEERDAEVQ
jgi:integrase